MFQSAKLKRICGHKFTLGKSGKTKRSNLSQRFYLFQIHSTISNERTSWVHIDHSTSRNPNISQQELARSYNCQSSARRRLRAPSRWAKPVAATRAIVAHRGARRRGGARDEQESGRERAGAREIPHPSGEREGNKKPQLARADGRSCRPTAIEPCGRLCGPRQGAAACGPRPSFPNQRWPAASRLLCSSSTIEREIEREREVGGGRGNGREETERWAEAEVK